MIDRTDRPTEHTAEKENELKKYKNYFEHEKIAIRNSIRSIILSGIAVVIAVMALIFSS